ncbi:hypothetical protein OG455_33270 [Kitasatospora sp. NBC_01287]|uniref:hypothetical protein n=1 Tax=Kitasatospora sp. NBC_01287 TaxID=2903573 RepID=UPI0022536D57|nr:hypothetical protein [Kitasatospora sp. NBC_01287]MCX4750325.1 hypothetical protein [Kitasatospora sp. NBC_01287]
MASSSSWDILNDTGEGDLVLAVDYSVNGRREAGFRDLSANLGAGVSIWETLAPPVGEEEGLNGDAYLARWLDEVRDSGRRVTAVLGYCASSAFASAIADGIAGWQVQGPKPVLFDPTPSTAWTILHFGFFKVIESLTASLSEVDVVEAQKAGWEAAARNGEDLEAFRTEIVAIYRSLGDKAFEKLGLNAELGEQLVAWFRGYVSYLIAAAEFTGKFDLSATTVICSSALEESPGEVLAEHRFDVDHSDLLRDVEVAKAVAEILN